MSRNLVAFMVAGLATAAAASAQLSSFQLDDGLFRYAEYGIIGGREAASTGGADFGLASGATFVNSDFLYQNWWWYRSASDTREYALSNQTSGLQIAPNTVSLVYDEPIGGSTAGPGLRFSFTYTLNQISPTQAAVTINWNIQNLTQSEQEVAFFSYTDWDVNNTAPADFYSRTLFTGIDQIRADAQDGSGTFATVGAELRLPDAWQIGPFTGPGAIRPDLFNTSVNNLNNLINGANPGDLAGAFQWNLTLGAGESQGGRITKGYNYEIPAPGAVALLGLGGLVAARRRRA